MLVEGVGASEFVSTTLRSERTPGTNGGGSIGGVGFLFNGLSSAAYRGGIGGTNGGADVGGVGAPDRALCGDVPQ